jgi:hypothetical protein
MIINETINTYPLSSPQQDVWFEQLLYPEVPSYHIGGYLQIDGSLELTVFEQALNQFIQANDALRIILHQGETLPVQEFVENIHVVLDYQDFSEQDHAHQLAQAWMVQELVKPFQLSDGPLY